MPGHCCALVAACTSSPPTHVVAHKTPVPTPSATIARTLAGALGAIDLDSLDVTLRTTATADQVQAFAQAVDPAATVSADLAKALAHLSVQLKLTDDAASLGVGVSGDPVVQLVQAEGSLSLRVGASRLASLAGVDQSQLQTTVGALPANLSFVQDLVRSQWVSLDLASLSTYTHGYGITRAEAAQIKDRVVPVLVRDLTLTGVGSTGGEHLSLSGNAHTIAVDVVAALKGLPGLTAPDVSAVPDRPVAVTAYLGATGLTRLTLDAGDLAPQLGTPLPIELDLGSEAPSISAPDDATSVDLDAAVAAVRDLTGTPSLSP